MADRNVRRTGPDGSFEFNNLPPGRVMILIAAPLYHVTTQRIVVAGEDGFVEVKLSIQASISGRALGPEGAAPRSGTTVWLASPATGMSVALPTDAAGMFSFNDLAAGAYHLTAEATGLGKSLPQDIILREDERRTGLELRFVVRAGPRIRVRITGLFPGEAAWVTAQDERGLEIEPSIDDSGAYVISGVPEGLVELTAITSLQRQVGRTTQVSRDTKEVTFDIQFPREARLSGRVTQAGRPVGNRRVTAWSSGPNGIMAVARTDPSGGYAIEGLSDGQYRISVEGGATSTVQISGDTVLDIELP
jgi:large repetitive protein